MSTRNGTSGLRLLSIRPDRKREATMGNCAGIDWASEKHDVLIESRAGEELLGATFCHDEDGISALCAALECFEVEVVAIERPEGLLVDRLLESGVRVLALHPNRVKAARDRFRASGGKSDQFDRFVLCGLARTDAHRFRILEPDSDQTKALGALTQAREDLVAARVAMANQLRSELERFWPGPIGLFNDLDSPISLSFLERYPSPKDANRLGEKRLAAFLKARNYNNRKTPAQLLDRLRRPRRRAGDRYAPADCARARRHAADDGWSDRRTRRADHPASRCARWSALRSPDRRPGSEP